VRQKKIRFITETVSGEKRRRTIFFVLKKRKNDIGVTWSPDEEAFSIKQNL